MASKKKINKAKKKEKAKKKTKSNSQFTNKKYLAELKKYIDGVIKQGYDKKKIENILEKYGLPKELAKKELNKELKHLGKEPLSDEKDESKEVKKEEPKPEPKTAEVKEKIENKSIDKPKKKIRLSRIITFLAIVILSTVLILSDYEMISINPSIYSIILYTDFALVALLIILFIHGHLTKHKKNIEKKEPEKKPEQQIKKKNPLIPILIIITVLLIATLILADLEIIALNKNVYDIIFYSTLIFIVLDVVVFISKTVKKIKNKKLKKDDKNNNEDKKKKSKITSVDLPTYKPKEHETQVDIMLKLIEEKENIPLNTLAKYFNVDKKLIEEWATILEDNKLVEIEYPFFGEITIKKWNSKDTK